MRNFQLFSLLILAVTLETHYALLRGQRRHVSQDDEFASDLSHRRFGRMLAPYSANAGTMTSLTSSTSTTTASTTTPRNMFSLTASPKLGNCGNPCYKDTDCVSGLVCFQRTASYQGAPGCPQASWNPYLRNYCVNATLVPPPPSPRPTAPPTAPPRAPPTPRPTPPPTLPLISVGQGISSVITDLKARLLPYSLNGGAELADTNTYQSRAVTRMAEVFGMQQVSDAKLVQFYVLYCIFEATNGVSNHVIFYDSRSLASSKIPGWIVSAGWISTESDISLLNPCKGWHGITCDSNDKITAIQLSNNRLTGSFPPEVVWLASDGPYTSGAGNLNRIDLNKNQFLTSMDGDTYWWWLHLGSNFEYLLLQQTSFGGNLGKLPPNLVEFDCSYTLMSGGLIDDVFTGLNRLKYASLDGNFFNATVPKVLGQLPALEYLYIADSAIRGDLSYMKGGMPKIVEHWIDSNPLLIGTIPVEVNRLSTLRSLSLSYNGLSGSIPKQFGALSNLQYLWLIENSLSGSIPTELGQLRRLNTLQLEGNQLTGTMPSQVCANYDGGVFQPLKAVGADCSSHSGGSVQCSCCTCCSYSDCNS